MVEELPTNGRPTDPWKELADAIRSVAAARHERDEGAVRVELLALARHARGMARTTDSLEM